ncbi:MAG: thioesterase [Lachnospiraceae bacterium]|nr:thioesterase [Lachnospiraceae bacterium]
MYSFTSRIRFSETDETGHLSLTGLINYLQDCCLFQSESLGVGPDYLKEHHHLWLLSGWQIVIDRYPKMFEEVTVGTIPYAFSGCLGWRNVVILDKEGSYMVRANCPWVYLNTDTGRPDHPDAREMAVYNIRETPPRKSSAAERAGQLKNAARWSGSEEKIPMEYASRKIKLPESMQAGNPVPVVQELIDSNHHVNNARYVEIAADIIQEQLKQESRLLVKEIRVEYKRQARLGDNLYPKTGQKDGWYYVSLEDAADLGYASVALRL